MKKLIAIHILLCTVMFGFAQRQASTWYFGIKAGLDFNQSPPQGLYDAGLNSLEGSATISDANGQMLFYTNGVTVNNKMHKLMKNGSGLMGDLSSTSNAVIVPLPGGNIYYLFTIGAENQPAKGFRYSIVDMSGDSGLGEVTQKNILIEDQSFEKLAAVHHCNKSDVWVTIRKWNTDEYHTYLVTGSGIAATPVVSQAAYAATNPIGALKFSANGKKLAAIYSYNNNEIELMDFDNTTGVLSNAIHFKPEAGPALPDITDTKAYGAEFSPNGNLLYISSNNSDTGPSTLYQFDISSGNAATIVASKQTIAQIYPWVAGALQIGPDQKIYMAMGRDTAISVIENPDMPGPACNFRYNQITLQGNNNSSVQYGLPNFIQSYFDTKSFYDFTRSGKCSDLQVKFLLNKTAGIDSVKWDFGDGNQSQLTAPTNTYTNPGFYNVKLTVYKVDCSGLNDVINHVIWVTDKLDFLGSDTATCTAIQLLLGIDDIPGASYVWNTGSNLNKITTSNPGTYWMEIKLNGCSIRDSVKLALKPSPVVNIGPDTSICRNKLIVLNAYNTTNRSYLWSTNEITPSITINNTGTYYVIVTENICTASDTVVVKPGDCDIYIPNAFTPNKNSLNETFGVVDNAIVQYFSMQIYSKWGQLIFSSNDIAKKWDGTFKGKEMPNGGYVWILNYTNIHGRKFYDQGTVMLIR